MSDVGERKYDVGKIRLRGVGNQVTAVGEGGYGEW